MRDSCVASNEVVLSTHCAYADYAIKNRAAAWSGYLWNRSATNETWTIIAAMRHGQSLWFDGTRLFCEYNKARAMRVTQEVTPGPHYVSFRNYGAGSDTNRMRPINPTSVLDNGVKDEAANYKPLTWKENFGWAIDRQGRGSDNWSDYEKIEDPGDGSFITASADASLPDIDGFEGATVSSLSFGVGAELNTMGGDLTLSTLKGLGTFVNLTRYVNTNTVTGVWTVPLSQIAAGGVLTVQQGRLVFGDGATLALELDARVMSNEDYQIAAVEEEIVGLPTLAPEFVEKGWRLIKSADGKSLSLRRSIGMVFIVK